MRASVVCSAGSPTGILTLAALAARHAALAQPAFEPISTDAAQARIVEQIQETQ